MIKQKRGAALLWIILVIILIAIGIGLYFWLSGGSDSGIVGGGSSIPQPPALPSD